MILVITEIHRLSLSNWQMSQVSTEWKWRYMLAGGRQVVLGGIRKSDVK